LAITVPAGRLGEIRDLGLPLIAVRRIGPA
jgi:hypothetical protein